MTAPFVDVATLGPIPDVLTYALPPEWQEVVMPGMRVLVPLGRRLVTGCVVACRGTPPVDAPKFVADLLDDQPALTPELLTLTQWMASYYVASWGEAIRVALPRALQTESVQTATLTAEGKVAPPPDDRTPIQNRILTTLTQYLSLIHI